MVHEVAEPPTYQSVNWGLTAAAGVFVLGRLWLRQSLLRLFYWDDLFTVLAFLTLVAHSATNQVYSDSHQQLLDLIAAKASDSVILNAYAYNSHVSIANNCLLYLVFWLVKGAFLCFYYLLFSPSKAFRIWWWIVTVFTFLTFWIPIYGILISYSGADSIATYKYAQSATPERATRIIYSCVFSVFTDVLSRLIPPKRAPSLANQIVMVLPLAMLRTLSMSKKEKAGLMLIFCVGLIIVALDILRVIQSLASNQALYVILEVNFAVIVACLPTFRPLLTPGPFIRDTLSSLRSPRSKEAGSSSEESKRVRRGRKSEKHPDKDSSQTDSSKSKPVEVPYPVQQNGNVHPHTPVQQGA